MQVCPPSLWRRRLWRRLPWRGNPGLSVSAQSLEETSLEETPLEGEGQSQELVNLLTHSVHGRIQALAWDWRPR